jgi:hypothetical protein
MKKSKVVYLMTNSQMVTDALKKLGNQKSCAIAEYCGLTGPALSGTLASLERRKIIDSSLTSGGEKFFFMSEVAA